MFAVFCRENKPTLLKFKIRNYEQLFDIDLASIAAESSLGGGTISDEPLYLVCTHGRRDKCCAKFGYPIYKFISKCTNGLAWQCSHVGGDRFAANLICFPHGLFYAHVTEGSGQSIIDAYVQQQLILDKYRGRACYSSPVQAADFFVRSESRITSIDELHHIDYERVNESLWRIRFATSDARRVYEVKVRRVMSEFQSYRTCHSTEEERVVQYLLDDYRVMSDESLMRS
jgi:hypothetical protein